MQECMLCKRDMKKTHDLFGKGCIKYIYNSLDLDIKVKDKEKELCKYIKKQTNIKTINKQEEQILIDRYLTIHLLNKLKYGNHELLKEQVNQDLILFNKNKMCSINNITLKEVYDLCKKQDMFDKNIKELKKNINNKNIDKIKLIISTFSFIFNLKRNEKQYKKDTFKKMQFVFWQTVVEGGRVLKDYNISAYLLQHSLEENPGDLNITDGFILDAIKEDEIFKKNIKDIVKQYGKKTNKFIFDSNKDDSFPLTFSNGDLYYSIHNSELYIKGNKVNNLWDLEIKLEDKYDYSKMKKPSEYYNDTSSASKSLFSSTLYNLASKSVDFKVIKEYYIYIKFNIDNFKVV